MSTQRRYTKDPLVETVIDFQVEVPRSITLDRLRGFTSAGLIKYPNVGDAVEPLEDGARTLPPVVGRQYRSPDDQQVFQVHLHGFTFHEMTSSPWELLRDEVHELWRSYLQLVTPIEIKRVAVRGIYHLKLPLPVESLKVFLRTLPEISSGLPQDMNGFFMRLRIPHQDIKGTLLLSETVIDPGQPDVCSIVLDIDMFRDIDVPQDDDSLWQTVEVLRDRQSDVFEACITDTARKLLD